MKENGDWKKNGVVFSLMNGTKKSSKLKDSETSGKKSRNKRKKRKKRETSWKCVLLKKDTFLKNKRCEKRGDVRIEYQRDVKQNSKSKTFSERKCFGMERKSTNESTKTKRHVKTKGFVHKVGDVKVHKIVWEKREKQNNKQKKWKKKKKENT